MEWFKRKKKREPSVQSPLPPQPPPHSPVQPEYIPPPSDEPRPPPQQPAPVHEQPLPDAQSLDVCPTCRGILDESGQCDYCKCVEQIASAEHLMIEARDSGIVVTNIESLLEDARHALSMRDFSNVERTIIDMEDTLDTLKVTYNQAQRQIAIAQNAINNAKGKFDVSQSMNVLQLAKSLMKTGHYDKALQFAHKSENLIMDITGRRETMKAELSAQIPKTEVGTREVPVCPACRNILKGKVSVCDYCHTPIIYDEHGEPRPHKKPTLLVPEIETKPPEKKFRRDETQPSVSGDLDTAYLRAEEEINRAETAMKEAKEKNIDLAKIERMLDFARAFLRGKNYEKSLRYAKKTIESVKEEMMRKS